MTTYKAVCCPTRLVIEGLHNRLKKMANVFEIVETVKKEQALTEVTMTQFAAGDTPHHHNRKVIQRDGKIDKPKQRFS